MKLNLNWLKDYVDIEVSPQELCDLLTMAGLEVEGLEPVGQSLEGVVVAKILSVEQHPQADRLFVCRMDNGREKLSVVCGAPNLKKRDLVPLALPGANLPGGLAVSESKIRGVLSEGMLLAEDEMGLTDDHTGILILPENLTLGSPVSEALCLPDWVLEISLTPNRPDCACVIGVAREIAALTGKELRKPNIEFRGTGPDIETLTSVTILDPDDCPRYAAGIIQNMVLKNSPFWMRYRLYHSDVRSINNIVDVTNYVMLEMGQPLHAFDYDRLRENRIVVKRAGDGDHFSTLDGQTRALNAKTLMICDAERSVAVGGVMGGLNSEIFEGSKHVLVESAYFSPVSIRRTSKFLGLSTEASYRFERGIDILGVTEALKRSISLMFELGGGTIATGIIDNYPKPYNPSTIDLRVEKTNKLLGTSVNKETMAQYLESLENEVQDVNEDVLKVIPPSFRVDLKREVDLMEEVARLEGFDNIPVTTPNIRPSEKAELPELILRDQIRSMMVGFGYNEIITYSFISPESLELLDGCNKSHTRSIVKIMNPITSEQSVMRTSLIPGLLSTMDSNILREENEIKLFEWGKIFIHKEGETLPDEKLFLGVLAAGLKHPKAWYSDETPLDFYDIKGVAEVLLKTLGFDDLQFKRGDLAPGYHPDISANIYTSGSLLGHIGHISHSILETLDLKNENVYLLELNIENIVGSMESGQQFEPLAKFPAVHRDISLIVPKETESSKILDIIESTGQDLVESAKIFDLYEGNKLDPSEKVLGFRIRYRSKNETLDGGEINSLHEKVIERIMKEVGGRLREG